MQAVLGWNNAERSYVADGCCAACLAAWLPAKLKIEYRLGPAEYLRRCRGPVSDSAAAAAAVINPLQTDFTQIRH